MGKNNKRKVAPTKEDKKPIDTNDLFNNPIVQAAIAALSEEDKERYKMIGDHLYGRINFEDEQSLNNMPPSMAEAVAYIEMCMRSGLHPSMLEDNERALLKENYGEEWYKKWGYVEQDLTEIVTVKLN